MRTLPLMLIAALVGAGLAACGGDPSNAGSSDTPGEVPASAAASNESYTQYVQAQPATDETSEPLGLNLFAEAPTSETASPVDFD